MTQTEINLVVILPAVGVFALLLFFGHSLPRVAVSKQSGGSFTKRGRRLCTKCGRRPTANWCKDPIDFPDRALCPPCYNNRSELEIAQDAIDWSKRRLRTNSAALPILTPAEDIVAIVREQGGYRCAICNNTGPNLAHDHSHETGEFRGILCETCNKYRIALGSRVGRLAENPDAIDKLANCERPPAFVHESANYFRRVIARRNRAKQTKGSVGLCSATS